MILTKRNILYTVVLLLVLAGCKKSDPPNFHFEYFGMSEGRYVIYNVMEITHDKALSIHDTVEYQMKTTWGDIYIDNEGREAREFWRYRRDSVTGPWSVMDLWTGIIDGIRGELIEENQRTVKLVFAPTLNKNWDANASNTLGELSCYYREIHQDTIVNNVSFDSTVVVEQEEYYNLIDSVRMYEVYAKNIGLIYKHSRDNHYQFGDNEVVNGTEVYYTYVTAGWE